MELMGQYPLRDVPLDDWTAMRQRAHAEGLSVRAVLIGLVRAYGEGRVKLRLHVDERRKSRGPRVVTAG